MYEKFMLYFILCMVIVGNRYRSYYVAGKLNTKADAVIDDIVDFKVFKKLLRTKTNVLVLFINDIKQILDKVKLFKDVANAVRGTGTMILIDCGQSDKKKLCKKLKISPNSTIVKHYRDGEYHKDYDRQWTMSSMVNFMRDPTGDLPWEEDPLGKDVVHFNEYLMFMKQLKKDLRPLLVMFYVPWCGFCKRLKPEYSKAATELKSEGYVLAAMDVERQDNALARNVFNITGFPTIIYFEKGKLKYNYEGEYNKEAIMNFMREPSAMPPKKLKDLNWSSDTDSEIVHLTKQGFEPALKDEKSVLVMFYAPWCGHCKQLKPDYEKAAVIMKNQNIAGILAAVDATKETSLAEQYQVTGYPTLKYFVNAEYKFDINVRDAEKIVDFMRVPKEPPPPPPPEIPWEEEDDTEVLFLNDATFSSTLKRKKHALVMFYAPWCGHCKNTKPEFNAAAKTLSYDPRIVFAAVDCTREQSVCSNHEVRGYPTLKYFSYLKTVHDYNGGRKRDDFITYMRNASEKSSKTEQMREEL